MDGGIPVKLLSITAGKNLNARVHMGLCGCTHASFYYNHEFCVPLGMNVIFVHYLVSLYVCCLWLCILCARVVEHRRFGSSLQQKD